MNDGSLAAKLNLTEAAVIKAAPGRLSKIVIIAPGDTSGAFVFNDCAAVADAAADNVIFVLPYNATANFIGSMIDIDWPCKTGIVLSAVPSGGSSIAAVSFV